MADRPPDTWPLLTRPAPQWESVTCVSLYPRFPQWSYTGLSGLMLTSTVQGQDVRITTMIGKVMIDEATGVDVDIDASNGVMHVIDSVLIPE